MPFLGLSVSVNGGMQFLSTNEVRKYQYDENRIEWFLREKGTYDEYLKPMIHA